MQQIRTGQKTEKEKLENEMSIGDFKKLQHTPENLEGHTHAQDSVQSQGCARVQERPEKAPSTHF